MLHNLQAGRLPFSLVSVFSHWEGRCHQVAEEERGGLSVPWETYTEGAGSLRGVPVARAHMELAKHGEGCLGFLVLALIAGVILSFITMTLVRRRILVARILVARILVARVLVARVLIARILVASEVLTYLKQVLSELCQPFIRVVVFRIAGQVHIDKGGRAAEGQVAA